MTPATTTALSQSEVLIQLGLIIVLAAAAPLIAKVLRLPSILMLLALGFGAGAIGALNPSVLLGDKLVSAIVSLAVGIILFDAGLSLNLGRLTGDVRRPALRLLTIGIATTWAVGTLAAIVLFHLPAETALVLGAVLVVSGPTVVGPLLDFIHPTKTVGSVLKWEGTLADPLGATLGVLTFTAVIAGHARAGTEIGQFLLSVGIGVGFGLLGAVLILVTAALVKPGQSDSVVGTLMFVVAMVVCADLLRDDTGLITGLVIGMVLVNRPPRGIEPAGLAIESARLAHDWRERIATLSTFLIGTLFIILSAEVSPRAIASIGWVSLAFIAVLVLIGRPLAVALSTWGSSLKIRERAFVAWMAPRGIVAAATSSTFAIGLASAHIRGAQDLVPITFIVIVATALIYGLTGAPVSRALGVAQTGPGGVLLIGGTAVGRAIAHSLQSLGVNTVVWTSNDENARAAESEGLSVYKGDLLQDATSGVPSELDQVQYALAVSDEEAFDATISADLARNFGRDRVFQLPIHDGGKAAAFFTRVPVLFDTTADHDTLSGRIEAGAEVVAAPPVERETDIGDLLGPGAIPMFVLTPGKQLRVLTADERPKLEAGQELVSLSAGRAGDRPASHRD